MTLLAAFLLTLGVVDLVRWTPEAASPRRTALALASGAVVAPGLALLVVGVGGNAGDVGAGAVTGVAAAGLVPALVWVLADAPRLRHRGTAPLAAIVVLTVAVLALVPVAPPVTGPLGDWYARLGLPGLRGVPVVQALTALAAGVFALSTANRVVRLVLAAAGTPPVSGEASLRGGRLLGPLERTFVLALALAGDLTAAAVVIAAKGVLRLPEIRSAREERRGGADVVTEYFLVGTFTSWLMAVGLAGLVRLAG